MGIHIETEMITEDSATVTYRVTLPGSDFSQDVVINKDGSAFRTLNEDQMDYACQKMIGKLLNQFKQRGYWPARSGFQS